MDALTGVYVGCFGVGLLYAIFSTIFSGHGDVGGHEIGVGGHEIGIGGHDIGHDVGGHHAGDTDGGHASPFSSTVIACFVTGFGAFGLMSKEWLGFGAALSCLFGIAGGLAVGAVMFVFLSKVIYASQSSSEGRQIDMIGLLAEVITPIPPAHRGEIAYILGGSRYTSAAMTEAPTKKDVPKGAPVRIKRVVGGTVYVEPEE